VSAAVNLEREILGADLQAGSWADV